VPAEPVAFEAPVETPEERPVAAPVLPSRAEAPEDAPVSVVADDATGAATGSLSGAVRLDGVCRGGGGVRGRLTGRGVGGGGTARGTSGTTGGGSGMARGSGAADTAEPEEACAADAGEGDPPPAIQCTCSTLGAMTSGDTRRCSAADAPTPCAATTSASNRARTRGEGSAP
jgi:hypothetical protein